MKKQSLSDIWGDDTICSQILGLKIENFDRRNEKFLASARNAEKLKTICVYITLKKALDICVGGYQLWTDKEK
jgi:hypothetical protein